MTPREPCPERGEQHQVITAADNPELYDPGVLDAQGAPAVARFATGTWGYCERCHQGFRWSVIDQEWRFWPSGLAALPQLDDEELEVLHFALSLIATSQGMHRALSQTELMQAHLDRSIQILQSFDTAVLEARYALFPREGAGPPERRPSGGLLGAGPPNQVVHPNGDKRDEIEALRDSDALHLLPPEALIASVQWLAEIIVGPAEPRHSDAAKGKGVTEREPMDGEVCSCGRRAIVVFVTPTHGDVPSCQR